MPKFYVYVYYHPVTKVPFYVGKGTGDRYLRHLSETKETTENYKKWSFIQGLRNKGLEPFIEKVFETDDEVLAYNEEARLISHYGRRNLDPDGILTNICSDNRPPRTGIKPENVEKWKAAISTSKKGKSNGLNGKKQSVETVEKRKNTISSLNLPPPMQGKQHSEETKKMMSESHIKLWDDEKRAAQSQRMTGRIFSEEHKKALSDSRKGRKHSEETKRKMREAAAKRRK